MELKHVSAIDEANKAVTILLYGAIGNKVDGDYFAQEIQYLQREYDQITIRINSEGGSVMQGLSIFNAILASKATIITHIDGIAASMAAPIALAGDIVKMNDFARIMVHNPFIPGRSNISKKEERMVENMSSMLADLLSRRGCEKEKMTEFMAKETWFKADEALALKLVDEVVNTGKAQAVEQALSGLAALSENDFFNFINTNKQVNDMKAIASLFGLEASATEQDVLNEIKALQMENKTLKTKADGLEKLANELKAEKAEAVKKEVEALADEAIAAGFFEKESRESLITMGTNSFDTFKTMIKGLKKPETESLTATLAGAAAAAAGGSEPEKDFEWYRRNDPIALTEMKTAEPERFKKLEAAWEKKYC